MALATTATIGALNVTDMQGSAQRVLITAVAALIAPLFWPGRRSSAGRTTMTIIAWSCLVACIAALLLLVFARVAPSIELVASVCGVLLLITIVTHAIVTAVETLLASTSTSEKDTREIAGRLATFALALVGLLPVWCGPAAQLATRSCPGLIDAIIALSPLTHLAVASGNDLLRNQWFYQHSTLSGLQFSYPSLMTIFAGYIAVAVTFLVFPAILRCKRLPESALTT